MRGLLTLATAFTLALSWPASAAPAARITLGPYVQDVQKDGFTVAYETDAPAEGVVVAGGARVVTHGTRHEAEVRGLAAGTRYPYQVRVGGALEASGEVATFSTGGTLRFDVFGDTRDDSIGHALAAKLVSDAPDLLIGTGDLVHRGSDEAAWSAFFSSEEPILRSVPLYPAAGNHELYGDEEGAHYRRYFVLPEDGRDRRYYSFVAGPARFIALDGNAITPSLDDPQTRWLERTLKKSAQAGERHVFVFLHQPPFSTGGHCGAAPAEAAWVALFERYRVRAVFAGHDHAYERLERNGIHYFVSGGGGAPLYPERPSCPAYDRAAQRRYLPVHHYLRVRVSGDEVEVAAIPIEGGAPLEVTRFSAGEKLDAGLAPPLVDDRLIKSRLARAAIDTTRRRWPMVLALLLLLVGAASLLGRRRR
jgi:hypothetical protein